MRLRKLSILLISLLFIGFLAACGSDTDTTEEGGEDPGTIVYGGASWLAHIPAYIGIEQGFFEEEGLDVEFQNFSTSSERMTSLAAGDVDFASTGAISALSLMAAGDTSFSIVGAPDIYVGQEGLVVSEEISDFEDLAGKQVAVPFSSSAHVMVLDLLDKHGLEPNVDVEVLNMDGTDMVSAFTTGEIDGGAIWVPAFYNMQAVEGANVLAKDTDTNIYEEYGFNAGPDVLVMRNDFIDEYPETAEKLMSAYMKSIEWVQENPEETAEIFVEVSNIEVEDQLEIVNTVDWLNGEQQKETLAEDGDLTNMLSSLSEFLVENELTATGIDDVKEWIDTDVLKD